jgi:hypothetical protein
MVGYDDDLHPLVLLNLPGQPPAGAVMNPSRVDRAQFALAGANPDLPVIRHALRGIKACHPGIAK